MRKHELVRTWVQSSKPSFGCLLETRVKEENSSNILNNVFPDWNSETNYDYHRLGRIWLVWSDEVIVTVLFKSPQMITVGIETIRGDIFVCSCIYASNFRADRQTLWTEFNQNREMFGNSSIPWILLGEFQRGPSIRGEL